MAINRRPTRLTIDLGTVVSNSKNAIAKARAEHESKLELEFQRAIADGMSYDDQVKFRQRQLAELSASPLKSTALELYLQKSITDTKKLARLYKFRDKYEASIAELSAGIGSAERSLSFLQEQLASTTDTTLRNEILNEITATKATIKKEKDTMLSNRFVAAQNDGTRKQLESMISDIAGARYEASINGNQLETELRDQQLRTLKGQLESVKIGDAMNNFSITSKTRGTGARDKVSFINAMMQTAPLDSPVRIGDRTYNSAQEFWALQRTGYLSGQSDAFGSFFDDVKNEVNEIVAADEGISGFPRVETLERINSTLNDFAKQPGVDAFSDRFNALRAEVFTPAFSRTATRIAEVEAENFDYKKAEQRISQLGQRFGIDVTSHLTSLARQATNDLMYAANTGQISPSEALNLAPNVPYKEVEVPQGVSPVVAPKPVEDINIQKQRPSKESVFPDVSQPKRPVPPMFVEPGQSTVPPMTGVNPPKLVEITRGQDKGRVYDTDVEHWKAQGWEIA